MTPGTVTLSLADVDQLRDTIKTGENKVKELTAELTEVKADRRVMKITKLDKAAHYRLDIDSYGLKRYLEEEFRYQGSGRIAIMGWAEDDTYNPLERFIKVTPQGLLGMDKESVEFINMEDVKEQIRQNFETQYAVELSDLRKTKSDSVVTARELTSKYEEMVVGFNKKVTKAYEEKDALNREWEQKYEDLANDKKRLSKEEALELRIQELEQNLKEEKAKLAKEAEKGFWKRVFNLKG